jgi:hypothetical protein
MNLLRKSISQALNNKATAEDGVVGTCKKRQDYPFGVAIFIWNFTEKTVK